MLRRVGWEVHRVRPEQPDTPRNSMYGVLRTARANGLEVNTVIDIGAASGTTALVELFPAAEHLLVEPLVEFESKLTQLASGLQKAHYIQAAVWRQNGEVTLNVHNDLVGSSLYLEQEGAHVNGTPRQVRALTLDTIAEQGQAGGPYLIKIDTQGAELDALKAGEHTLAQATMVLIETSFFEFFAGGPQFQDCCDFMTSRGFVIYDLFDAQYRPLDGALSQIDVAFVRREAELRAQHVYATPEQRAQQDRVLRKRFAADAKSTDD